MAVKFLNIRQEGVFRLKKKEYFVEVEKKSTAEVYNFYSANKGMLLCSVYTRYNSRAVGVKEAGSFEREVYGDFSVYLNFINTLDSAVRYGDGGLVSDSRMIVDDMGYFIQVVERKGDYFYHKQCIKDNNVIEEYVTEIDELSGDEIYYIELKCVKEGKSVLCKKVKGVEYKLRDSGEKVTKRYPIKTLDMLGLEYNLDWLESKNYRILNTKEDFEEYLERLEAYDGIVGFDTETTGLKINRFPVGHPERDYLVGICLSIEDNEGVYIPIKQRYFDNLDEGYVIEKLKPYIDKKGEKKKSLGTHGGKFDFKVMYTYGVWLNIENDSYILQYMLTNGNFKLGGNGLKELALKEFGMDMIDLEDHFFPVRGKKADINFSVLPYDNVKAYAPADADATRMLIMKKLKELPASMRFLYWVEIELMKYIGRMEYYGIKLDIEKLVEQKKAAEKGLEEARQRIIDAVGHEFNVESVKELTQVLYDELGYKVFAWTDKGAPSTSKLALELLSKEVDSEGRPRYPVAGLILEYRKVSQLLSGFLKKMLNENIDGYVFPLYNQAGTDSGRISCKEPNLQQTPGRNREVIIPDSDDYYFIVVDYSQVEYRIMAGIANEVEVVESFKDPDADHHIEMYARMYNMDRNKVTKDQRKKGKTLNFGLSYGMGPRSLALKLFTSDAPDKVAEAKELSDRYWDSVPNIRDMLLRTKDRAYVYGYVTTKFGRRRYIRDIRSDNYRKREGARRQAGNTRIQGTGADILKIAHVKVEREIDRLGLDAQVKISMHDELVVQVNKNINPWWMIKILRECMELKIKGFPPLYIGACVGGTWAVGKRDDLEVPIRMTEEMFSRGEHLVGAYEEPGKVVREQIQEFQIKELKRVIKDRGLDTIDKALNDSKVDRVISNYFSGYDAKDLVGRLFCGEDIKIDDEYTFYNDGELEFDEDVDEGVLVASGEESVDKGDLKLEEPEVRTAEEAFKNDYRVIVHDRKCFIRVDNIKKSGIRELRDYLERQSSKVGNDVVLVNQGVAHVMPFKLYNVDKLKLSYILDKHTAV